jgi:hypothetical protein
MAALIVAGTVFALWLKLSEPYTGSFSTVVVEYFTNVSDADQLPPVAVTVLDEPSRPVMTTDSESGYALSHARMRPCSATLRSKVLDVDIVADASL